MKKMLILLLAVMSASGLHANMKSSENLKSVIFFTHTGSVGQDVLIRGKVISISSSEELPDSELSGIALDKTKVTVRLFDRDGLNIGDVLYVIDKNNLVVSKFTVKEIFYNQTFGYMLIGYGNLKLSGRDYRVAQAVNDPEANESYKYKSRGDYYHRTGDKGKAIAQYKKAIELNRNDSSSRFALGMIYYNDKIYNFAYNEFKKAYEHIENIYDNEDRFVLLKSLAELCFLEAYHSNNLLESRKKFSKDGIKYCKEALRYNRESVDIHSLLGDFYYMKIDKDQDSDRLAKEAYMAVLEQNPAHFNANYKLAKLYMSHNNNEKALLYIRKAVMTDPSNEEALELLKNLE
ncbi:MAG TPA: tetratricopeptide repeat protein [Spirochaetota bacterium]|nr:tetratricopeptide repeat protein [Spirochaetota bacterium]